MGSKHKVVIVGGGFGGLNVAKGLRRANVDVTLVDRHNYHLFQPLLYQVATGGLSPANIASPLRGILNRQRNTSVLLAEAIGFDIDGRRLLLSDGELAYDTLVLASGAEPYYYGNQDWPEFCPGLKSIEDATEIRRRILIAFEAAERETLQSEIDRWMTFVIVGAGPTGVELAGAIAEIARDTLRHDFRRINPADARIVLVEGNEQVLGTYPARLGRYAQRALERLGVSVLLDTRVFDVSEEHASVRYSDGREEVIPCRTILWAAGVKASPLGPLLAKATGAASDGMGRIKVDASCNVPGHPEIFVIGDLAQFDHGGVELPGVAAVAAQQGTFVARVIRDRIHGAQGPAVFHYNDKGSMATIGRASAVADLRGLQLHGPVGWLAWLFVHILLLIEFEDKLAVMLHWVWNYFSRNRSARLITGEGRLPQLHNSDVCALRDQRRRR